MFSRKPSSIRLLAEAERADADADAALALVSKARSKAMRQRFLAARVEAEELADRLERKAHLTKLLVQAAKRDHHVALNEESRVKNNLQVATKNAQRASRHYEACIRDLDLFATDARIARSKVSRTKGKE